MGGVKSKVDVEGVNKEVTSNPVVLYTKGHCGFCVKAKNLLVSQNITFKEFDLDVMKVQQPDEYTGVVNGLVFTTRQTSVPQVFICGKFVGGFTDLNALNEQKKLIAAIEECLSHCSPLAILFQFFLTANPVVLYTKGHCGFCVKAKNLLVSQNITFKEFDLDVMKVQQPDEYTGVVNGLVFTTRQTSVPQVFICGKFVGGFTDLNALNEQKKLIAAIEECTGENAPKE